VVEKCSLAIGSRFGRLDQLKLQDAESEIIVAAELLLNAVPLAHRLPIRSPKFRKLETLGFCGAHRDLSEVDAPDQISQALSQTDVGRAVSAAAIVKTYFQLASGPARQWSLLQGLQSAPSTRAGRSRGISSPLRGKICRAAEVS